MTLRAALLATLFATAALAHAETWKWVDEKGVTNYSSSPPPSGKAAKALATVEDRVSVYAAAPLQREAAALERRERMAEAEWLQRQRLMAQRAAYATPPGCLPDVDCTRHAYRVAGYYPVLAYPVAVRTVRTFAPRPRAHRVR